MSYTSNDFQSGASCSVGVPAKACLRFFIEDRWKDVNHRSPVLWYDLYFAQNHTNRREYVSIKSFDSYVNSRCVSHFWMVVNVEYIGRRAHARVDELRSLVGYRIEWYRKSSSPPAKNLRHVRCCRVIRRAQPSPPTKIILNEKDIVLVIFTFAGEWIVEIQ